MKVSSWLSDWLILHKAENDLRPRTVESYSDLLGRYVFPAIGDLDMEALTPDHLRHLLAEIVNAGHTRTAELVYIMLNCAFNDLDINPLHRVKRPKHHQKRPEPWTDEQMIVYLSACLDHRHGLALSLALLLGLRRGEICGLRWSDIDFTSQVIHIVNQRVTLSSGITIDCPPKSESGIRDIPIPEDLFPMFKAERGLPSAYLCPLTPSGLDQAHSDLVKRLELPRLPLHGLRHTMASSSIRHGGNLRALQYLLGHASYTTTANIYTHPDRHMLKASLDAAGKPCYTVLQSKKAQ